MKKMIAIALASGAALVAMPSAASARSYYSYGYSYPSYGYGYSYPSYGYSYPAYGYGYSYPSYGYGYNGYYGRRYNGYYGNGYNNSGYYGGGRSIRCESNNGRYRNCGFVDRRAHVEIRRQLSNTSCVYGRSWGVDGRQLWVSNGCRADFVVY